MFRDDRGALLEAPYACAIITSPAVHALGVRRYMPERLGEIGAVMFDRILKVLAVAERHGHRSLILGAWGCGAFGNDPATIAALFRDAIAGRHAGAFAAIVFAITDWSDGRRFLGPFADAFGVPRT